MLCTIRYYTVCTSRTTKYNKRTVNCITTLNFVIKSNRMCATIFWWKFLIKIFHNALQFNKMHQIFNFSRSRCSLECISNDVRPKIQFFCWVVARCNSHSLYIYTCGMVLFVYGRYLSYGANHQPIHGHGDNWTAFAQCVCGNDDNEVGWLPFVMVVVVRLHLTESKQMLWSEVEVGLDGVLGLIYTRVWWVW